MDEPITKGFFIMTLRTALEEQDKRFDKKLEDKLEEKLETKLNEKLDKRFEMFEKSFEIKMDKKIDEKFEILEERIDNKMDEKFEIFERRVDSNIDKKFDSKFYESLNEQQVEFQRYIGIVSEEFQSRLQGIAEMVSQNTRDISEMREDIDCIKSDVYDIRYELRQKADKEDLKVLRSDLRTRGVLTALA